MRGNAIDTEDDMRDFLRESLRRSYFLHFAGAAHLMGVLGDVAR
jgi:hypothetical protein